MPLQEVCARQHVVGVVTYFMRENILNDNELQPHQRLGEPRGISLAVEHRRAGEKGSAHRIGLAGLNGLKNGGIRAGPFRIKNLVERLLLGSGPSLAVRSLAFAARKRNARRLKAASLRNHEAAWLVNTSGKGINKGKKRKVVRVVAVTRGIPAVIGHAALREEFTRDASDRFGRNTGCARSFLRRPMRCRCRECAEAGFSFKFSTVKSRNPSRMIKLRIDSLGFRKAYSSAFIVFFQSHHDIRSRLSIHDDKSVFRHAGNYF